MQQQNISADLPLISRPTKVFWGIVLLLGFGGLAFPVLLQIDPKPSTQSELWMAAVYAVICGIPALCLAWYLIWCRVVADHNGLLFQRFFSRKFVPWQDIEDFELRFPAPGRSKSFQPYGHIRTGGNWIELGPTYSDYEKLLEVVEREAMWSWARQWQNGLLRADGDWPKTFVYREPEAWLKTMLLVLVACVLNLISLPFSGGWQAFATTCKFTWAGLSPWGRAGFALLPFAFLTSLLVLPWALYNALKTPKSFRDQKIIATFDGLSSVQGPVEIFLPWKEVRSYHFEVLREGFQNGLCVVETTDHRIEFANKISGGIELTSLIETRSENVGNKGWRFLNGANADVLGNAESLWKDGALGVGPKIHHYRTRTGRAYLGYGITMVGVSIAMPFVRQPRNFGDDVIPAIFLLVVGAASVSGTLGYCFTSLLCEEDGLRKKSVWGDKFIPWNELKKFAFLSYFFKVTGKNEALYFPICVADLEGLVEEIEKRSGVECTSYRHGR